MAPATSISSPLAKPRAIRFVPSLPDLLFPVLLLAIFGRPYAWRVLLHDGDTGWHIRAGEWILDHGVPARDLFSFSRPDAPWYAWEWLSEAIFAQLHRWWGLEGIAALGAVLVCLPPALLFAWLLRRGSGAWVALGTSLLAASAASVHYLARPHLFSLALLVAGLWLLDDDRRAVTPWLWTLAPMAGLWANLHGGFAAWLAILWLLAAVCAAEQNWGASRRYGLLAALSSLATLVNPYGWQLHRHVLGYLGADWIRDHVEEFQSPQIRAENMWVFALLLLAGIAAAARGPERAGWFERGLVFLWGLAALRSARYVPLFAIVVAPVIACFAAGCVERAAARSAAVRALWESSRSLGEQWRITAWLPVLGALALLLVAPASGIGDFPDQSFPVIAVNRTESSLISAAGARILTSDQWGDYLIYRLYPKVRVFYDGRSDFYGERIGDDYRVLLEAGRRSGEVIGRSDFPAALLPLDWPLGQILERDPDWRVAYRDKQAVLLLREGKGLQ